MNTDVIDYAAIDSRRFPAVRVCPEHLTHPSFDSMIQLPETFRGAAGRSARSLGELEAHDEAIAHTRVTMKDIAREVGLVVTTVSRALNDHDDVALETRTLVHELARRLDYHPNAMARSLQNSRADAIGLLIPPILHRAYDAFWLDFIGGAASACANFGSDLLLSAVSTSEGATMASSVWLAGVGSMACCCAMSNRPILASTICVA